MPVYVSDRLTATLGVVRGSPTPTRLIQWFRGSTVISGANASTYTITSDDLGQPISVRQTETNYFGSAVATSAATEDVEVFDPSILFSASEPGVWFDPTDAANLAWRRNRLLYTEQFDNAIWLKDNGGAVTPVVTADYGVAPDGTSTADRFQMDKTGGTYSRVQQISGLSSLPSGIYTFSVWMKNNVAGTANVGLRIFTTGVNCAVTTTWQRFSVSLPTATTEAQAQIMLFDSIVGNDETADILVWGAQLELGSTPTAYQPITNLNAEVIAQFPNATLYQDAVGTIPVYSPEQPVGLMLDKSQGLVLGPELVVNGTFDTNTTGWVGSNANATLTYQGGGTALFENVADFAYVRSSAAIALPVGAYRVSFNVLARTNPAGSFQVGLGSGGNPIAAPGAYSYVYFSNGTAQEFQIRPNSAGVGTLLIDNISVRALPGNHATQSTAISRPLYGIVPQSGRRNLLTYSEQFDNAVWVKTAATVTANAATAPDGTMTAEKVEATFTGPSVSQDVVVTGTSVVLSSYFKKGTSATTANLLLIRNQSLGTNLLAARVNLDTGEITYVAGSSGAVSENVGDGWWRLTLTVTVASGTTIRAGILGGYTATPGDFSYIWGAQLETGSTATAYQKVTNDYDVTEAGVASVGYLRFDGTNDFMLTSTITPGTDKAQVFAGVGRRSATTDIILEFSTDAGGNNGALHLAQVTGPLRWQGLSRGTVFALANAAMSTAPAFEVASSTSDIGGDRVTLRVNGTQVAQTTTDQGTGNYLAYPMYIGRRAGTSLEFNGQLFPMIVRFGPNMSSALIRTTENWVASKTAGVVLP